jgi:hypothetical protein
LTELSEFPAALERIEVSLDTLVFLDHDPVPEPELIQALQQIHAKAGNSITFFHTNRLAGRLPDELRGEGSIGAIAPGPLHWTAFARMIDHAVMRVG